jgi:hypothetical protein
MTTGPTAFLDASVIYPAGIRNLLMCMQLAGTFRATWSDMVHEEWITALLHKRPHLTRTRDLMNQHAVGATITGYEGLIDGLRLPDVNVQHVLADLKHFPASALSRMHRRSLKSTPKPVADYLAGLEKSGFTGTVAALRPFEQLLE